MNLQLHRLGIGIIKVLQSSKGGMRASHNALLIHPPMMKVVQSHSHGISH